jgi:DNA repair protein RecO (recombination protein O)
VPQEKSEAVVMYGVDYSESSRIITFLSPQRGRLACLAKGIRRKNSPLAGALDTFNRLELVYYWKDGRQVQTLAEASVIDSYPAIKQDLARGAFAGFVLEIASKVAHENEPSETLYAELVNGLSSLARWPGDARAHACWQTYRLLAAAGFEPVAEYCSNCGAAVTDAPGFALDGGVTCPACRSDRRLSSQAFEALLILKAAEDTCPEFTEAEEVFRMLKSYAAYQLETDFRSVRVLDQLFG